MERIKLSEHFNYRKLFRFVLPSVIMMAFVSIYGIVDGFFVSNFAGKIPFAALNLIFPMIMILGSVGFMLGTGGNAVVAKTLGEGEHQKANQIFSLIIYTAVVLGVILSIIGIAIAPSVARLFAQSEKDMSPAEKEELIACCILYVRIILSVLPAFMLQNAFQGFFVTAEKPRLGLYVTVLAGVGNILFDALFVAVFKWGLAGAAAATALNQVIGGIIPIVYFSRKNDSLLRLGKTRFMGKTLLAVCINGMSELMTNISMSIVTILYNAQLMRLIGISGVSAYGIMQYLGFIFVAMFLGYSVGSAPIIGFHYGAQNHSELKNIFKKSLIITSIAGAIMTLIGACFAVPLASIFADNDAALLDVTVKGMRIFAFSFLTCGLNIFASAFFTALSNGGVSLLISFTRTFICQAIAVIILPIFWGVNGVWASLVVAEMVTVVLCAALFFLLRKRYQYI